MERVLSSEEFRASHRLQGILRYVVEETLAGRSEGIKAATIALEVFQRDVDDDSGPDSIVRVAAARLRRKLSHYYGSSGQHDPVRIEIATGHYVPTFTQNEDLGTESQVPDQPLPEREAAPTDVSRPRWPRWLALAFGVLVLIAVVWTFAPLRTPDPVSQGKPFVAVLPLVSVGGTEINARLATGYIEAVVANLTKLSGLSVMAVRSSASVEKKEISLQTLRDIQGVSHVLKGVFATQSETVRVNVELTDTGTGRAVWAERFEGNLNDLFSLEDRLANRIATVLSVTIDPDESRRIYLRHTSNREAIELLRRATHAINPPADRARIETARGLHQRVIDLDPDFAGGYAGMSEVHSYMVLFGHSNQPEEDLKSAIEFARKAIKLDDSFGMGHSMLGFAYALDDQTDLALAQLRRAVALEPGDPFSYQWLAGVLIWSGRYKEAVAALQEALRLDPIEPRTAYLNISGMAYFNLEQYDRSIEVYERNLQRGGPDNSNKELFRAAAYAALGRETKAREVIAKVNMNPSNVSPEYWIRRWARSQKLAEKTLATLRRLGLKNLGEVSSGKSP